MSKTMTSKVSEYHGRLAQAMAPLRGRDLTQAAVRKAYAAAYPDREEDLKWLIAADHSINHTNEGACECSLTDDAIFDRLGYNRYRVR